MAVNVYASDNYIIINDGTNESEYAKGYTVYTFKNDIFTIKETVGGEYKITIDQINDGDILDESNNAYDNSTFTTFLRQNTGFKTAPGGSGALLSTGSPTDVSTVWVGTQAEYNALTPDPETLYFIK